MSEEITQEGLMQEEKQEEAYARVYGYYKISELSST